MFFDPLEQFLFYTLHIDTFFRYSTLWCFQLCIFAIIYEVIPTFWYNLDLEDVQRAKGEYLDSYIVKKVLLFIKNVVNNAILVNKNIHFGIILNLFIFIVTFNLIGMIPYTFTLTSIFIITFNVSAAFFLGSNIIAILLNKYVYTDLFMPKGVPTLITPFLLLIELISYFSRVFSLAIRLFANMLSGHILLKILMGLMWVSVNKQTVLIFIMPMAVLVISAVIGLELTIAFLQAYVFITLVCSYVNDAINVH